MKAETAPIRLSDYRPPDFLIETVDLDFHLEPGRTRGHGAACACGDAARHRRRWPSTATS